MLALLLAGSLAVSAPVPKALTPKHPPDPERLQGAWDIDLSEHDGKPYQKAVWTFDGEKMTSRSENGKSEWGVRLDPVQSPKRFDLVEPNGQYVYPGIYEFDGDKLKIAYSLGGDRPAEFKSSRTVYLNVLVRAKDPPKK